MKCPCIGVTSQPVHAPFAPLTAGVRFIGFLTLRNESTASIHGKFVVMYRFEVITRQHVTKWARSFKKICIDIHDEKGGERPSVISEKLLRQIEEKIRNDRRGTLDSHKVSQKFHSLLDEIVSKRLAYIKLCAKQVPKISTSKHRGQGGRRKVASAGDLGGVHVENNVNYLKYIL